MKKFISSILVVLFMFTTPVSRIDVYARDRDNHSAFSVLEGPLSLAIKIILYPLAIAGGICVVAWGAGKAGDYLFGRKEGETLGQIGGVAKKLGGLALEAGGAVLKQTENFVHSYSEQLKDDKILKETLNEQSDKPTSV